MKLAANKGRHFSGKPIAKSGTKPPSRTGSPSGNFVGTGINRKSIAGPEHSPSKSSASTNYTKQAEQFVNQSPEPFRNPHPAVKAMNTLSPQQAGGPNKAYAPFRGSRVSVNDGNNDCGLPKPSRAG